jgi:hypothetical protein
MARQREVYYGDHVDDFGLSGLTGKVCSRSMLRLDEATVLALAQHAAAEEEDDQLGVDVQVLMNSPLLIEDIHAKFDADGRAWFTQIAEVCRQRLKDVDPVYAPFVSPARVEAAEAVLQEVREMAPDLTNRTENTGAATVRSAVTALDDLVRTVDPDLGFRLLLQILSTCDVPITEARRARCKVIAERLGYGDDHIDDRLPAHPS